MVLLLPSLRKGGREQRKNDIFYKNIFWIFENILIEYHQMMERDGSVND